MKDPAGVQLSNTLIGERSNKRTMSHTSPYSLAVHFPVKSPPSFTNCKVSAIIAWETVSPHWKNHLRAEVDHCTVSIKASNKIGVYEMSKMNVNTTSEQRQSGHCNLLHFFSSRQILHISESSFHKHTDSYLLLRYPIPLCAMLRHE